MIVYHYHPDTGAFLNTSSEADPDPMEPGHWLIPANATPKAPPSPPDPKTQWAVFVGDKWAVEDIPVPPRDPAKDIEAAPKSLFGGPNMRQAFGGTRL